jgi:hypothetical protein
MSEKQTGVTPPFFLSDAHTTNISWNVLERSLSNQEHIAPTVIVFDRKSSICAIPVLTDYG